VLCSFGRAQRAPTGAGMDCRREDVHALTGLLLARMDANTQIGVGRILRRVASPGRERRSRDARWLARQLAFSVPDARLPVPAPQLPDPVPQLPDPAPLRPDPVPQLPDPAPLRPDPVPRLPDPLPQLRDPVGDAGETQPTGAGSPLDQAAPSRSPLGATPGVYRRWGRPARVGVVAAGLGLVVFAGATGMLWWPSSAPSDLPLSCPAVDDGCRPVATPGGLLTTSNGQYLVGEPGDVVVLGRWLCGQSALPAVLRPSTGQLWTFAHWPAAGQTVTARLLSNGLHGARSLRVRVQRSGCDEIEVDRWGQPPVTIRAES
jgi:hypothetical protein